MKNPYQTSGMKRMRRRSMVRYLFLCGLRFPQYVLWGIGALFSAVFGEFSVMQRILRVVMTPFVAVIGFLKAWIVSRPYRQLLIGSPILLGLFIGFSVFYINANKEGGGIYEHYYERAREAFGNGEYEQADILFGKLLEHVDYKNDDRVMFQALMSATQNQNFKRMEVLKKRLVYERNYEPAKFWLVEYALARGGNEEEEMEAMAREAIQSASDVETEFRWKKLLARHLFKRGRAGEVLNLFEISTLKDVEVMDVIIKSYMATGDTPNGVENARKMMGMIESRMRIHSDKEKYRQWLTDICTQRAHLQLQFRTEEKRVEAFRSLDKAIGYGSTSKLTRLLQQMSDLSSKESLWAGDIVDLVAKGGGSAGHVVLGIRAWGERDARAAELHFEIAASLEAESLAVLQRMAVQEAEESLKRNADRNFLGLEKAEYERSVDMLDVIEGLAPKRRNEVLFTKCFIFSLAKRWDEIERLITEGMSGLSGAERVHAYGYMIQVGVGRDDDLMRSYQRLQREEIVRLRKEKP